MQTSITNHTRRLSLARLTGAALVLSALLASCGQGVNGTVTPPTVGQKPSTGTVLGQVEVTFNRDAEGRLSATARPMGGLGAQALTDAPSVQLVTTPVRQSSFTVGARTGDLATTGQRYLSATFSLNNTASGPLTNVSLIAVATPTTTAGTAVRALTRFDGSTVSDPAAIARRVVPTQSVYYDGTRPRVIDEMADFQVYQPGDLAAFGTPAGADALLPYGFVATTPGGASRTLAPGSGTGEVTVSARVPLMPSASEDVFSFSMVFQIVQDSVTRVTQSVEEQDSAGNLAVLARADRFAATEINTLPGSTYDITPSALVCSVPLNKSGTGTDAFLVNKAVSSVTLNTDFNRKLLGKGQKLLIPSTVNFTDGTSSTQRLTLGITGAAASNTPSGLVGTGTGAATVTSTACGVTSSPLNLRVLGRSTIAAGDGFNVVIQPSNALAAWGNNGSGVLLPPTGSFKEVAAGYDHALGIKTNSLSTVVGWGGNSYGQTTIPVDLDVSEPGGVAAMNLAAGAYHSLALKADGTVSAWGRNDYNQNNVPAGLSNVLSIAEGAYASFAVKRDGTVVGWGSDAQPGASLEVPAWLSDVVSVTTDRLYGGAAAYALKADGTVMGWGYNTDPNSGSGMEVPSGLTNVVQVVTTSNYAATFALKSDGSVIGWGNGTQPSQTFEIPAGLNDVVSLAIAPYGGHILALKSDGSLVTWGPNIYTNSGLEVPAGTTAQLP